MPGSLDPRFLPVCHADCRRGWPQRRSRQSRQELWRWKCLQSTTALWTIGDSVQREDQRQSNCGQPGNTGLAMETETRFNKVRRVPRPDEWKKMCSELLRETSRIPSHAQSTQWDRTNQDKRAGMSKESRACPGALRLIETRSRRLSVEYRVNNLWVDSGHRSSAPCERT